MGGVSFAASNLTAIKSVFTTTVNGKTVNIFPLFFYNLYIFEYSRWIEIYSIISKYFNLPYIALKPLKLRET